MAAPLSVKLKDHTVLALDIGSRFMKVAEMRLSKGEISLLNVAAGPTPPGIIDNSQIIDPAELGRAIRDLLVQNKIKSRKVVTAVRGQSSVVVRPIDLPKMTRKELADTMKFEVERHIPFSVDEVVMDYAPITDPDLLPEEEGNMKVLLAVAQEELVMSYVKALLVAGLKPVALDVEILSAMRSLVDILAEQADCRTVALVNIGASSTDISIVNEGNLMFTRSVPIAGDAITQAIADQLGRGFEEAEDLKKELARVFLDSAVDELPMPDDSQEETMIFGASAPIPPPISSVPVSSAVDPMGLSPLPSNIFSLDDDEEVDLSGVANLTVPPAQQAAPAVAEVPDPAISASPAASDNLLTTPEDEAPSFFRLDADDEDESSASPMFTLGGDAGDEPAPGPVFSLGGDDADEVKPADSAPVFDFTSELAGQMPAPLARASYDQEPESSMFTSSAPEASAPSPSWDAAPESPGALPAMEDEAFGISYSVDPDLMAEHSAPLQNILDTPSQPDRDFQNEIFQRRLFDAFLPTLGELVTEVRRSLEYFSSREPDAPVEKIIVFGGTSRLPYLVDFFQHEIGLDVQIANPMQLLNINSIRQPIEYLEELAPALPICIGLGLRDMLA